MLNKRNYAFNKQIKVGDGFINGQRSCSVSGMRYGLFPMSYNGCGVIALYNLMYRKRRRADPADIAREIYPYSAILFGLFGNKMLKIEKYLNDHGLSHKTVRSESKLAEIFSDCDCFILGLWNDAKKPTKGKHFVFVRNIGGKARVYNCYSNKTSPTDFESVQSYLDGKRLTVAYCFQ